MQVQNGLVKYKDRSDIVCTYGVTDDGRTYYFLDGEKLNNGFIIASTALVEAIDPLVVASQVGVIDADGNEVIPFNNKSIKVIGDKFLLIETAQPKTNSVLEAISLRKDPLAATKLVSTSAAIKEKMYAKMGPEGRFVFNDQFSEAMLCDMSGNNLFGTDSFSFVGVGNDTIYLSHNTVDSEIIEYPMVEQIQPVVEEPVAAPVGNEIDVTDAAVSKDVIDSVMTDTPDVAPVTDATPANNEVVDVVTDDVSALPATDVQPVVEEVPEAAPETIDIPQADELSEEVVEDNPEESIEEINDEQAPEFDEGMEPIKPIVPNMISSDDDFSADDTGDGDEKSKVDDKEFDFSVFGDMEEKEEPVEKEETEDFKLKDDIFTGDEQETGLTGNRDSVFDNAVTIINKMIGQIEEQKQAISDYEAKVEKYNDFKQRAYEENKKIVHRYENLLQDYKQLESELDRKDEIIASQKEELAYLRSQVDSKNDLAKILEKAQGLFDNEYEEDFAKAKRYR